MKPRRSYAERVAHAANQRAAVLAYVATNGWRTEVEVGRRELAILRRLADGDRIVRALSSSGFQYERGGRAPHCGTVRTMVAEGWISPPNSTGPLFGDLEDGVLTEAGRRVLARYNDGGWSR